MRLASVIHPLTPHHLQLAAQCGVTDVVGRYPGPDVKELRALQTHVEAYGLRLGAIEGFLPIERLKTGRDDDGSDLAAMKTLLRHMGETGVPLLCYNFMAGTDWVRTNLKAPERGGALVTAFDLREAERAVSLSQTARDIAEDTIGEKALWENLTRFLDELLPVAEQHGVTMAMHPDDPPLPEFRGKARIMNCVENFERLMKLAESPSHGICFCQGTFAAMGVDIPSTIRRLGPHIRYVHFRDVRGTAEAFAETFHDNGPTDMAAAMRAYREIGFHGLIRPDHVPQLDGEEDGEPGYTMLGRLFAFGYIRGLIHATS